MNLTADNPLVYFTFHPSEAENKNQQKMREKEQSYKRLQIEISVRIVLLPLQNIMTNLAKDLYQIQPRHTRNGGRARKQKIKRKRIQTQTHKAFKA